jgi:hypothetical protein
MKAIPITTLTNLYFKKTAPNKTISQQDGGLRIKVWFNKEFAVQ